MVNGDWTLVILSPSLAGLSRQSHLSWASRHWPRLPTLPRHHGGDRGHTAGSASSFSAASGLPTVPCSIPPIPLPPSIWIICTCGGKVLGSPFLQAASPGEVTVTTMIWVNNLGLWVALSTSFPVCTSWSSVSSSKCRGLANNLL